MTGITVTIPVYNTEKYLERCLDSVQGQTFRDLEILCIDDGSTDRSPEILRQRAASDARIRVITLPGNRGIPHARNLAIDEARGEYLYYMDSDDWLDPDYLEAMYGQAQRTGQDVVINGNWIWEYDDPWSGRDCTDCSISRTMGYALRNYPAGWTTTASPPWRRSCSRGAISSTGRIITIISVRIPFRTDMVPLITICPSSGS